MGTALVLLTKDINFQVKPGKFEARPTTIVALACYKNSTPRPSSVPPGKLKLLGSG